MPSAAIDRPALVAAAGTHAGLQRENNEDRYHCDPQRGIFMVIDGVGGHAAGEKAAETALTIMRARLERETGSPVDRVREAITLANNEIVRLADSEPSWAGMACVLTVALVRDGTVTVGHVGDTRLYAFTRGALAKVTHDHSPVGEREDHGELDELEAMRHPRRNEIYRDVGSQHHEPGDEAFVETIEFPFEPDTALVLCTDGLSDLVTSSRLARIVADYASEPTQVVERLIEAANEAGGKDNISLVFVAGPRFADTVQSAGGQRPPSSNSGESSPPLGAVVRSALSSRPAVLLYGLLAGLALAAALMIFSNVIPDRLLDASRPAAWTRTWSVGTADDADFASIQEALRRAQPGDVVEVQPGTYDLPIAVPPGVHLESMKPREVILASPADGLAPHTPALTLAGRSRVAGFKIDASGLATGILAAEGEAEMEDLEIVGAANAAVVFGPGSRGVLRSSYLHDNSGTAVLAEGQALPRLLHNVITGNGRKNGATGARGPQPGAPAASAATPAVVLAPGASAVFFGNIVAGNADDQIAGLAPERRADVLRDNVIGLAARAPSVARPPAAPAAPRPAR